MEAKTESRTTSLNRVTILIKYEGYINKARHQADKHVKSGRKENSGRH
ncbi:MAG: hypothetical protein V8R63_02045 [Thomasclavelia ramosa]